MYGVNLNYSYEKYNNCRYIFSVNSREQWAKQTFEVWDFHFQISFLEIVYKKHKRTLIIVKS